MSLVVPLVAPWLAGESLAVVAPWTAPQHWVEAARDSGLRMRLVVDRDWAAFVLGGALGLPVAHLGLSEAAARKIVGEQAFVTSWDCLSSSLVGPVVAEDRGGLRWVDVQADRGVSGHRSFRPRPAHLGAWLRVFADPRLAPSGAPIQEGQDGTLRVDADRRKLVSRLPIGAHAVLVSRESTAPSPGTLGVPVRAWDQAQRDGRSDTRLGTAMARPQPGIDVILHVGRPAVALGRTLFIEQDLLDPADLGAPVDLRVEGRDEGQSGDEIDAGRLLDGDATEGVWRGLFGADGATALEDLADLGVLGVVRATPGLVKVMEATRWKSPFVDRHAAGLDIHTRWSQTRAALPLREQPAFVWTDAHGRDLVETSRVLGVGPAELADVLRSLDAEGLITATLIERVPGGERVWQAKRAPEEADADEIRRRVAVRRSRQAEVQAALRVPGCRRVAARVVLGLPEGPPCGHCDRCEAAPAERTHGSGPRNATQGLDPKRRWARAMDGVERVIRQKLARGQRPTGWEETLRSELAADGGEELSPIVAAVLAGDSGALDAFTTFRELPGAELILNLLSLGRSEGRALLTTARAEIEQPGQPGRFIDRPLAARLALLSVAWVEPLPILSARELLRWSSLVRGSEGLGPSLDRLIDHADGGASSDWSALHDGLPDEHRARVRLRARGLGRADRHLLLAEIRALAWVGRRSEALDLLPSAFSHADAPEPLWWLLFSDLDPASHDALLTEAMAGSVLPEGLAESLLAERDAARDARRTLLTAAASGDAAATMAAWTARHPYAGPRAIGPDSEEDVALRSLEVALREAQLHRVRAVVVAWRHIPPDPQARDAQAAAWAAIRDAEDSGGGLALRAALRRWLRAHPEDPWPMLWLARSGSLARWTAEVERCYEEAIELIPSLRLAGEVKDEAATAARAAGSIAWAARMQPG